MAIQERPTTTTRSRILWAALAGWLVLEAVVWGLGTAMGLRVGSLAQDVALLLGLPRGTFSAVFTGRILLLAISLGWGLLYGAIADRLPGSGWVRGAIFGLGVWFVSALALFPILTQMVQAAHGVAVPGLLGRALGRSSAVIPLSLLAHLGYGITLGSLARARHAADDGETA